MSTFHRLILGGTLLASTLAFGSGSTDSPTATTSTPGAHWHHGHGGHRGGANAHLLKQLNLKPEQKTAIQSIYAQARPQFKALAEARRTTHDQLASTLPSDPAYAALLATAKNNADAEVNLRAQTWGLVLQELSPGQVSQIPVILAARKQAWATKRSQWKAQHPAVTTP